MKRASEAPFPYGWPGKVCYIEVEADRPIFVQLNSRDGLRSAVIRATAGECTLLAAWPGQYRLFWIDKPELLAAALGMEVSVA